MISRSLSQQLLTTRFLIERDALTACFLRFQGGFTPTSEIKHAQDHINHIQTILNKINEYKDLPKTTVVAESYTRLVEGCCPRK